MYEKLKSLLKEWEVYSNPEEEIPSRIRRPELWSIGRSVELTLNRLRWNILNRIPPQGFLKLEKNSKYANKILHIFFIFTNNNK